MVNSYQHKDTFAQLHNKSNSLYFYLLLILQIKVGLEKVVRNMVLINLTKMAHNEDGAHHVQETRSVSQTRCGPTYMCNVVLRCRAARGV